MPNFQFQITADATQTALVTVAAETIDKAHDIALQPEFFQDPSRAAFEFDAENIVRDVYLPDASAFSIVDANAPEKASATALRDFWRNSPLIEAYFSDFCVGAEHVAGGVLSDDRIVFASADREDFYIVSIESGAYVLGHTHDGLLVADHEAELEVLDRDEDIAVVVRSAFRELGFEPTTEPAP